LVKKRAEGEEDAGGEKELKFFWLKDFLGGEGGEYGSRKFTSSDGGRGVLRMPVTSATETICKKTTNSREEKIGLRKPGSQRKRRP